MARGARIWVVLNRQPCMYYMKIFDILGKPTHPLYQVAVNFMWSFYVKTIEDKRSLEILQKYQTHLESKKDMDWDDKRYILFEIKKSSRNEFLLKSACCLFDSLVNSESDSFEENVSWCNEFLWMVHYHHGGPDLLNTIEKQFKEMTG